MIRSFCSADQLRRRSTVEIISDDMCLTVLKHVNKDSMIHLIPPRSARRQCHSPERTLTSMSPWRRRRPLSAVQRLGGRFGRGRIVDHLLGKTTDASASETKISTFGIGRELQ